MAPIKVGIVGYGFSTRTFHLPFILPNKDDFEVVAFLQRDGAKARGQPASLSDEDYPGTRRYKDIDSFLGDKDVELVIVVTGHDTHAEFAEKALLAGKHVVCEKVFTCTSEEADRVIAAGKKSGKVLTVFQSRRYDSDMRTLQSLMDKGVFGQIVEAEIHYDVDSPYWSSFVTQQEFKPGGGMLYGIGCHILDQALHLFGKPHRVTGFYRSLGERAPNRGDNASTVILQYDPEGPQRDLIVSVKSSLVSKMRQPLKYFIRGYDGTFEKYGEDPQEGQIVGGMLSTDPKFGYEDPETYGKLTTSKKVWEGQEQVGDVWVGTVKSLRGDYHQYYKDVARAIRGEIPPVINPETSRDGIRVIELARQSQDEGRTMLL